MFLSLRVVELFSGIGAWRKALENLGVDHETVLAVDFDEYPMTAYNAIHGSNFPVQDITALDAKDVPDFDVLCYSPPCQAFSRAGRQLGFDDHRGVLFFDALRIIKEKKPKYCLMENVKGLVSVKFKDEFEMMLESLEEAGYTNHWTILNSKDFGIPQTRNRVFIVSIRNDLDTEFNFPKPRPLTRKLEDFIEEDAMLPILHNIYGGFGEDKARVFDEYSPTIRTSAGGGHIPSVVITDSARNLEKYIGEGYKVVQRDKGVWRVRKDNLVTTIDANYHKGMDDHCLRSAVFDGVYAIRMLTPLETFRLMGFEDQDYYNAQQSIASSFLKGNLKRTKLRMYKLAGNSIVVDVCMAIFNQLLQKQK